MLIYVQNSGINCQVDFLTEHIFDSFEINNLTLEQTFLIDFTIRKLVILKIVYINKVVKDFSYSRINARDQNNITLKDMEAIGNA